MISWFEAVVLGIVQGLTEFLPISSSAHVFVISEVFGWGDPGAIFTAITQIGTELAVLIYFRHEIGNLLRSFLNWFVKPESRGSAESNFAWAIVLGSLPIGIVGFALQDLIESDVRNLNLVGGMLILFGLILIFIEKFPTPNISEFSISAGFKMGLAQTLALIPGVSRSGATISAGIAIGLDRATATRYSFLLAIPAVLASGVLELTKISESTVAFGPTMLATLIAGVIGYAVIAGLLNFLKNHTFAAFGYYRIVLGLGILLFM